MSSETVTRAHLVNAIYNKLGLSLSECGELVETVLEEVIAELEKENKVKISSFGTFEVSKKKARIGRNPKTGVEVMITPRKVLSFHASNILKKKVNDNLTSNG